MAIDWTARLRQSVFSTVPDERLKALVDVSVERAYPKYEDIVRQDEKGASLFVIGSGSAEALLKVGDEDPIQLSTMREGDVFGEMAVFEKGLRAATVRAKEPCTVLEIPGAEFQKLADEYPQIEVRLLVKMSERLRETNGRILALQVKTFGDKLKLFNDSLDTERRAADAEIKAAQAMFDQTKLRTDEVIARANEVIKSAAESRDWLTKSAKRVGSFLGVIITVAGFFGWKQVSDATKSVDSLQVRVADSVRSVESAKGEATKSQEEARKSQQAAGESVEATKKLESDARKLMGDVSETLKSLTADLTKSRLDILYKAMEEGSGSEAYKVYSALKGELDDAQFGSVLLNLENEVVAKAPKAPLNDDQKSKASDFISLFQQTLSDARTPRNKLDAYYLLLTYAYLTHLTENDDSAGGLTNFAAARAALAKYVNSTEFKQYRKSAPNEGSRIPAKSLVVRIKEEPGKRVDELQDLSHLALVSWN